MNAIIRNIMIWLGAMIIVNAEVLARGETPPPPPFIGGAAGEWLGSGPVFGFESWADPWKDGGGANGGWGGAWWDGDGPWGGWGDGSGGRNYDQGSGGTDGRGNVWAGTGPFGGLQGNCWRDSPSGGQFECGCLVQYNPQRAIESGTVMIGTCQFGMRLSQTPPGCLNVGDPCTHTVP